MTAARHRYDLLGLRLGSEIELSLPPSTSDEVDVVVRRDAAPADTGRSPVGVVLASAVVNDEWWYTVVTGGDGYLVRFRDCADFAISPALDAIEVRVDPNGARAHLVPVLLAGTVAAVLLMLRGSTLLHASAVSVSGSALAFVGQSGRGKSTMAALLCRSGADLVTDDVLAVEPGDPALCRGGASELRLRNRASALAATDGGGRVRPTVDERTGFQPSRVVAGALPLGAVVVPTPDREIETIEVVRFAAPDALFALLAFPRVFGWRREVELSRDFAVYRALVETVPMYLARIPWGLPFDPHVAEVLTALPEQPVTAGPEP